MSEAIDAGRFCKGSFTYDHILNFGVKQYKSWHGLMVKSANEAAEASKGKGGGTTEDG